MERYHFSRPLRENWSQLWFPNEDPLEDDFILCNTALLQITPYAISGIGLKNTLQNHIRKLHGGLIRKAMKFCISKSLPWTGKFLVLQPIDTFYLIMTCKKMRGGIIVQFYMWRILQWQLCQWQNLISIHWMDNIYGCSLRMGLSVDVKNPEGDWK